MEDEADRYKNIGREAYEQKGLAHYVLRVPVDRIVVPLVQCVRDKKVIDVGCGTGHYSRLFAKNNEVTGVDVNPHLAEGTRLHVIAARAERFASKMPAAHYDVVFSAWMTEYLDKDRLSSFFKESYSVLPVGGELVSTMIDGRGLGFVYVLLAALKGIRKYSHPRPLVVRELGTIGFKNIKVTGVPSWLGVPFAYVVSARK
jgi:predicted TPR repeat methyltransferase